MNPRDEVVGPTSGYEETLRLIAHVPVPEGLVDRVQAEMRKTPAASRSAAMSRVTAWPFALNLDNEWRRAAAAAAIVFVVAGGGWGIYSTARPASTARVLAPPPRVAAPGGFSSAGAMRTPQTLNGPVLTHTEVVVPKPAQLVAVPPAKATGLSAHYPKAKPTSKAVPATK